MNDQISVHTTRCSRFSAPAVDGGGDRKMVGEMRHTVSVFVREMSNN